MSTLTDLAKELLSRGVYCVLNANIPRDIGQWANSVRIGRKQGIEVPLACVKKSGRQTQSSKVAITLGRSLEDRRELLASYGFDLIQITQDALDHNLNGIVDMVEEKVLGVSRAELLWLVFEGYSISRITEKTGLTKRQIQIRMRRWFGCTIPELRRSKSPNFPTPVLEVCPSERDVRVPERVFV
jgi:hypothetical protein